MLLTHLVPGYFLAQSAQTRYPTEVRRWRRGLMWATAFTFTVLPDSDVIYNIVWRGFANHSWLWAHSLFGYLGLLALGMGLRGLRRLPFCSLLLMLAGGAGLSHLLLDVIAHGTPLFYPFSRAMIGFPPPRVVEGGLWAYLTDPIFLLEPLLFGLAALHWLVRKAMPRRRKRIALATLSIMLLLVFISYWAWLPVLQNWAAA
ncbi:MAG: hypothetical protein WAU00_17075 [Caldilinea sp.]